MEEEEVTLFNTLLLIFPNPEEGTHSIHKEDKMMMMNLNNLFCLPKEEEEEEEGDVILVGVLIRVNREEEEEDIILEGLIRMWLGCMGLE